MQILCVLLHILWLQGSCSSGKSTWIQSHQENYVVVDEDTILFRHYREAVAERAPEASFETICQVLVELNQDPEWKKRISGRVTEEVLCTIEGALKEGKDVLLDAWYVKPEQLSTSVEKVLLYCPFSEAFERLLKRNGNGNLFEIRLYGQLVGSFCTLYKLTDDPEGAIEKIDRAEIEQVFDTIAAKIVNDPSPKTVYSRKEMTVSQLEKLKEEFLGSPGCYIAPKKEYDRIIIAKSAM